MDSFLNTILEISVEPKVNKPKEDTLMLINYEMWYSKPRMNISKINVGLVKVVTSMAIKAKR